MQNMKFGEAVHGTLSVLTKQRWMALDALHAITYNFKLVGRNHYKGNWYTNYALFQMPEMIDLEAHAVKLTFWGGPPVNSERKYRDGSVMDYLMDTCFYTLAMGDPDQHLWDFLNDTIERSEARNLRASTP